MVVMIGKLNLVGGQSKVEDCSYILDTCFNGGGARFVVLIGFIKELFTRNRTRAQLFKTIGATRNSFPEIKNLETPRARYGNPYLVRKSIAASKSSINWRRLRISFGRVNYCETVYSG